ncbi:MAG: ureidoglycolate lyase [Pseudomonadota bacterium]
MIDLKCQPLTAEAFAQFGDVIEVNGPPHKLINAGKCGRHHDLARLDFRGGRAGISLFNAEIRSLPYILDLMERHPDGSQAFIPMAHVPFLVTVAPDEGDRPGTPLAFMTRAGQGINLHRGIWHGVLTPLHLPGLFAVVDQIGDSANLDEVSLDPPFRVVP